MLRAASRAAAQSPAVIARSSAADGAPGLLRSATSGPNVASAASVAPAPGAQRGQGGPAKSPGTRPIVAVRGEPFPGRQPALAQVPQQKVVAALRATAAAAGLESRRRPLGAPIVSNRAASAERSYCEYEVGMDELKIVAH